MNVSRGLEPSLLDRLLDDEPQQRAEPVARVLYSLAEYKARIVRDLETLMNTRQLLLAKHLQAYPLLLGSLLEYGMPDFTSSALLDPLERRLLQNQLERTITLGDRRFRHVRVQLLTRELGQKLLAFRVDAVLRLPGESRQVTVDAVLQIHTQEYQVQALN